METTIADLVTIDEVRKAVEETGKKSLKRVLEEMEKYEQKKIDRQVFDKAMAVKECTQCHRDEHNTGIGPDGLCRYCRQENQQKVVVVKGNEIIVAILTALNLTSLRGWELVTKGNYPYLSTIKLKLGGTTARRFADTDELYVNFEGKIEIGCSWGSFTNRRDFRRHIQYSVLQPSGLKTPTELAEKIVDKSSDLMTDRENALIHKQVKVKKENERLEIIIKLLGDAFISAEHYSSGYESEEYEVKMMLNGKEGRHRTSTIVKDGVTQVRFVVTVGVTFENIQKVLDIARS